MNYSITNPPYNKGQHVDFVNLCTDVSNKTVAVHPSTPIISMKDNGRDGRDKILIDNLDTYESSVDLMNGYELFSALIEVPISLTYINKNVKRPGVLFEGEIVPTSKINLIGSWSIKFYDLISDNNLSTNAFSDCNGSTSGIRPKSEIRGYYFVSQCWKRGSHGFYKTDFYTILPGDKTVEVDLVDKTSWLHWGFETEQEAVNFIAYCKTKFARFMLALYKVNGHLEAGELKAVPWMDFTQEWDDDKLFRHFNVSKADQQLINNFIPNYYD